MGNALINYQLCNFEKNFKFSLHILKINSDIKIGIKHYKVKRFLFNYCNEQFHVLNLIKVQRNK